MPFTVQVVTPDREVSVCDDAKLLIAKGIEGDIGIMAGHAPVLIALSVGPLTLVREGDVRQTMVVDGGFLQMNGETAIVLAEYVILPQEIDIEATRAEITELERRIAADGEAVEEKSRLARAKAIEAVHGIERM
ncbi:MAG: ATP synthase F1 subunit epsilon [Actinomycetota bacterium]|nr:ATP synthase F1 subunit epsilon [Actinomycetota bacterium]